MEGEGEDPERMSSCFSGSQKGKSQRAGIWQSLQGALKIKAKTQNDGSQA